jgi:hypothetical protein
VADFKTYLVVMVICFDSPLVIQIILKVLKVLGGLGGLDVPLPRFDGCPTKILSTSLGIFVCILGRSIPFRVCGLDFLPIMIWVGVVVNGVLIIITIE